ncbi:MAG TPA: rod shape-determining protein RodA [Vicinamibacterales bacterium]|nr:rod shape-determining protein RodA [Vicinamibacterales bacterium]
MIVDRRPLPHLDLPLLGGILALCGIGLVTLYSVSQGGREFWTQVYWLPVGLVALTVCLLVDYRSLSDRSLILYGLLIVGLLLVWQFGVVRGGSRRWLSLAGVTVQPSEFGRIVVALVLAAFYGENRRSARTAGQLVGGALLVGLPAYLIYRQPDLGTAVTLVPVFVGIVFVAGLPLRWMAAAVVAGLLFSPVVWMYGLQDYQRERIETFLDPSNDPRGAGYQQIQAKITVGSGGLTGKGFGAGTQSSYGFMPEAHNDFVFSSFAEEFGFVGVLVTLALYLFVLVRSVDAARLSRDRVGAFLVVGLVSGFGFQVLYNLSMSAGFAPVKGLTLPLMSYGGSSLVSTLAAFGLILNVRMRRFSN